MGLVPMGKLEPRVQWNFVPSTKIAIIKQKIDFWPQISKFWGQKSTFSPLAANWSLANQCFQHEKGVSLESRYEGTKIFTPCPQKNGFWAQKRQKLAKNWHFGPNIGIFGPFDLMPDQKTMQTNCLGGFCYVGTKTFTYSHKNYDFRPKNGQIWSKICIFGHFGPNIAIFCTFCPMPDQKNNVNKVPRWVFRYVGNNTFNFSSKNRIFCPKKSKFGPKMAFLFILGQALDKM